MALHLPIGPLKTRSRLERVHRCKPSTYSPLAKDLATVPLGPVEKYVIQIHYIHPHTSFVVL